MIIRDIPRFFTVPWQKTPKNPLKLLSSGQFPFRCGNRSASMYPIIWYALYAPTTLRHLIFGGWTCILKLFTDFFKGISIHSIGWIFSRRANRTMQEDLSATADSSCAGAPARHCDSGGIRLPTENLTNWDLPGCEKPPKTNE